MVVGGRGFRECIGTPRECVVLAARLSGPEYTAVWDVVAIVAVAVVCLAGIGLTAFRLPGTWLIVATALGHAWWSDWTRPGTLVLGMLIGAAATGELAELLLSVLTARGVGGSRQAAWGGLIGGFLGMFFLTFIPIPVVGSMIGAILGCFTGAMIGELHARREFGQGTRVGVFSALGFVLGAATKLAIAMAMAGLLVTSLIWGRPGAPVMPEPTIEATASLVLRATEEHCSRRTGAGAGVTHLEPFDGFVSLEYIRRRDAGPLILESFDHFVS